MLDAALSIKTTVPRRGVPKYNDVETDGAFVYAFQSRGPEYHDNVLLKRAIELGTPLIYFYGVEPGIYRPMWPTYAVASPADEHVLLTVEPGEQLFEPGAHLSDPAMRNVVRRYATVEVKKRLHQDFFRGAVLQAYGQRCAVCRLPRRELLDAAHILSDGHARGEPVITNGLALCRLHHGAYDAHLLGIRPDLVIEISQQLMDEHDGPTLEHGLKGFNGKSLHPPHKNKDQPNPDHLAERYELFRRTA
jgi:putative restriction endonuclease